MLYSGEVQAVKGIKTSLSVGQVVWAPSTKDVHQYLVFVGWSADMRKLGIKYCYNRPCALYAVRAPLYKSEANELELKWVTLFCKMIFFITFFFQVNCYILEIYYSKSTCIKILMNFLYCPRDSSTEDVPVFNLTQQINSAFFPTFRYATNIAYLVLSPGVYKLFFFTQSSF